MIISLLLTPIFSFLSMSLKIINGDLISLPPFIGDFLLLLKTALMFFPVDVWVIFIANVTFWISVQYGWAIIEWIYKKIPGVN